MVKSELLRDALEKVGTSEKYFVGTKFDSHDFPYEGYYDWDAYAEAIIAALAGSAHEHTVDCPDCRALVNLGRARAIPTASPTVDEHCPGCDAMNCLGIDKSEPAGLLREAADYIETYCVARPRQADLVARLRAALAGSEPAAGLRALFARYIEWHGEPDQWDDDDGWCHKHAPTVADVRAALAATPTASPTDSASAKAVIASWPEHRRRYVTDPVPTPTEPKGRPIAASPTATGEDSDAT